jgi:hypothetical protein
MTEFDAEVFVQDLEDLGIKLNAVKFPDGIYRINRWLTSYALEHGEEVNERWQSQLRSQIVGYPISDRFACVISCRCAAADLGKTQF